MLNEKIEQLKEKYKKSLINIGYKKLKPDIYWLISKVERLKRLVKDAYYEGYRDRDTQLVNRGMKVSWDDSKLKEKLEEE